MQAIPLIRCRRRCKHPEMVSWMCWDLSPENYGSSGMKKPALYAGYWSPSPTCSISLSTRSSSLSHVSFFLCCTLLAVASLRPSSMPLQ